MKRKYTFDRADGDESVPQEDTQRDCGNDLLSNGIP